jgi:transposase
VRTASVFARLLGFGKCVIEGVEFDAGGALVISARPAAREASRCGVCRRRCPGYDQGAGVREWRALDFAATPVFIRSRACRVRCERHGVVVAAVPWARHGARHTVGFEDLTAWAATELSASALAGLLRIGWRTVGAIVERVVADHDASHDRLAGLRQIGIDEVAIRKGRSYLVVVVDHASGRLVWAREGRDAATVDAFFAELGPQRTAQLTHVSADMGNWLHASLPRHLEAGTLVCIDPFHVVQLVGDALDEVRRETWNEARRRGDTAEARRIKGARFALWKRPERLSTRQSTTLQEIAAVNGPLYHAYLLKEQLRLVLHEHDPAVAPGLLDDWLRDAGQSGLAPFAKAARTIAKHREQILLAITERVTNARVEALNTTMRLLTRRAYGFHTARPLIALAMLKLGGHRPSLPTTA